MRMTNLIGSIRAEYVRYKALADAAIAQLSEADLAAGGPGHGNSIITLCWHISGNLQSRFTDFLTTDGEKPWRQREEEFQRRTTSRADLLAKWDIGWSVLLETLGTLSDDDLDRTVTIRGQAMRVHQALHRSLAHTAYHVGQIVHIAKTLRGDAWTFLSIPPGKSDEYNRNANRELPSAHAAALQNRTDRT
jgi:uncharacterized damage-inducible protein DinB